MFDDDKFIFHGIYDIKSVSEEQLKKTRTFSSWLLLEDLINLLNFHPEYLKMKLFPH